MLLAAGAVILAVRLLQRAARGRRLEEAARERREAELREANAGQFAGRVAHDVLSPLSTTMLSLDLVHESQSCQHDAAALKATERGRAALQRVQVLVDGLLAFARAGGQPATGEQAELGPVLRELCEQLAADAQDQNIAL